MIRFQEVDVCYTPDKPILSKINLKIDPDSFHFLTGTSGAGKRRCVLRAVWTTLATGKAWCEQCGAGKPQEDRDIMESRLAGAVWFCLIEWARRQALMPAIHPRETSARSVPMVLQSNKTVVSSFRQYEGWLHSGVKYPSLPTSVSRSWSPAHLVLVPFLRSLLSRICLRRRRAFGVTSTVRSILVRRATRRPARRIKRRRATRRPARRIKRRTRAWPGRADLLEVLQNLVGSSLYRV